MNLQSLFLLPIYGKRPNSLARPFIPAKNTQKMTKLAYHMTENGLPKNLL